MVARHTTNNFSNDVSATSATPSDSQGQQQGLCEPQEAINRLGGLTDLYADVLGRFFDDSSGTIAQLEQAVAQRDAKKVMSVAHSLKGLALMCGAVSVAEVSGRMEASGRAGTDAEFAAQLAMLHAELALARVALLPYRVS